MTDGYQQPLFQWTKDRDGHIEYWGPWNLGTNYPRIVASEFQSPFVSPLLGGGGQGLRYCHMGRKKFQPVLSRTECPPMEWLEYERTYSSWYYNPLTGESWGHKTRVV